MQAISWCHNYFIFNFFLKPSSFEKREKVQTFQCFKKQKSISGEMMKGLLMVKYKKIANASYQQERRIKEMLLFFIYSLAAPWPTWGHYWRDSVTHPMLITAFIQVSTQMSLEGFWLPWGWFLKPGRVPSWV